MGAQWCLTLSFWLPGHWRGGISTDQKLAGDRLSARWLEKTALPLARIGAVLPFNGH
jgi:hypothetical protein